MKYKKEKIHCTTCGEKLLVRVIPAVGHYYYSSYGGLREFTRFNKEGWEQELLEYYCPKVDSYKPKWYEPLKDSTHDTFTRRIEGKDYHYHPL